MTPEIKRDFSRMVAARKALVDLRGERMEQLLAVRAMLRALLADFFETLDPITNLRLAEVTADGSKTNGDLSVALSFFEGTKMRIAVDVAGRFSHSVSIPSTFDDVERVVAIRVSADAKRAEVLDLVEVALSLLDHAVCAVEAELPVQPARAVVSTIVPRVAVTPRAPLTSSRIAAADGATSIRTVLGPSTATPTESVVSPPLPSITEPDPGPKILTLRLG
jgi:hypothetical protein